MMKHQDFSFSKTKERFVVRANEIRCVNDVGLKGFWIAKISLLSAFCSSWSSRGEKQKNANSFVENKVVLSISME